jgi:hypothetical protein
MNKVSVNFSKESLIIRKKEVENMIDIVERFRNSMNLLTVFSKDVYYSMKNVKYSGGEIQSEVNCIDCGRRLSSYIENNKEQVERGELRIPCKKCRTINCFFCSREESGRVVFERFYESGENSNPVYLEYN